MSRHVILDRPNLQIVLGFDHMLCSFFGQVFDPSNARREGIAIGGWPTRSGLGMRRPVRTRAEAEEDSRLLVRWTLDQRWAHAGSTVWAHYVEKVRRALLLEWELGEDGETPPLPDLLREGR
ncbi:hypothetical protein [uncultured Methylobacterium sp.]|uniref:hypothetical protein n=1 Tax=uncultured Methylobacterium sp. TaxID=157278 RepID=UPI0035CBC14B